MEKRVVVHAIRGYLSPTETFVGKQIMALRNYRPIVLAGHRRQQSEFHVENVYIQSDTREDFLAKLSHLPYSTAKALSRREVESTLIWLKQQNPDLWHFHFAVDAAYFLPVFRRMSMPSVVSLYGYDISSFPGRYFGLGRLYISRIFDKVDYFLAMTNDMKQDAIKLGIHEEKVLVHYHGIDTDRFRFKERCYENRGTFEVLCVGTLERKKGQHHLVRAIGQLRAVRPDIPVRLTLVGKGPLAEELKESVKSGGLEDVVRFAGFVPHLSPKLVDCYRNADAFVHFSTTQPNHDKEGIPGTVVEAMAAGLPVVSTYHAGIPEAITDGKDGLLLMEHDTDGIAEHLIRLYEQPDLRRDLGQSASERAASELDIGSKTRELESIYDRVLAEAARGRGVAASRSHG